VAGQALRGNINWKECENSLTTSIKRWEPSNVTFVFARDLSEQRERSFDDRLVRHADARAANVEVFLWNQSEVVRRLDESPDIKTRFFGEGQEGILAAFDRAIKTGGQLQSGADLVERAKTLSEYAEQRDIDFTYGIVSSSTEAPAPQWPELPYLTVEVAGPRARVKVAAWPRQGADVQLPGFAFTDDDAGQAARDKAVRAWAHGDEAVISEGARAQFCAPELIRELLGDQTALQGGSIRIPATKPFEAELDITTESETLSYRFQVRPVPPRPGAFDALAGYTADTFVEIGFALLDEQQSRATFTVSAHLGLSARTSLEATRLIRAWCTHERLTFRSEKLYPEGIGGRCDAIPPTELCEEMEWRARFYSDLVFLEHQLGVEVPLPDQMTVDDMNAVGTAANVLRTGEGTATFTQAEGFVQNPAEIPRLPDDVRKQASRRMVSYHIFGRELELGEADYELPTLKVVEIVPHGQTANAPARVVLAAEGDGQMRFRLVNWKPPAEAPS
jgi:hypothetical protein